MSLDLLLTSSQNKSREEERGLQKKEHHLCLLFPLRRNRQKQILGSVLCTVSLENGTPPVQLHHKSLLIHLCVKKKRASRPEHNS
ncbi:Dynein Heavy Chain 14, Axonemal [Manis pentadactyla]|nr:Dynein Heavy Chain 14, Axonemal [Manis pentadactyla]